MVLEVGKIGLWAAQRQWPTDVRTRTEIAVEVAAMGIPTLWIGAASGDLELPAAILDGTEGLSVGTSILNIWTEKADIVADHYAMLAKAHPDRLLLGFGVGHRALVEQATSRRWERPVEVLLDYLDTLDELGVPREDQALAALGPRVLEIAARRTAGALPYLVNPEHTRKARAVVGPDALLAPEQKVVLETDPGRARATARRRLAAYLAMPNYTNNLRRLGYTDDDLAGGGSDRLVDDLVAWGDIDTVLARVAEHHAAGADHVAVQVLTDDPAALPRAQWARLAESISS
ncbi:LLM class F420-dependent oxidoreductase [Frankia sp. AgKG'84/4]|uniref:LLM class F420-dependent oxidoreductase n=1 Tax=Frankia sp. AgKG'84/4 TaxID=573490 RepID=UPI0020105D2E|nr:LLM class F420-dependent oxidoreductase [Frankia sp. AgKG'84/4]MCL9793848.1 LLM class F420-dependent oxidoreductase [Frankia sp. AgKG'84/4]